MQDAKDSNTIAVCDAKLSHNKNRSALSETSAQTVSERFQQEVQHRALPRQNHDVCGHSGAKRDFFT